MNNFIYIYGPDGAGKSTHSLLLSNKLRAHGHKVKRVCIRSNHYPFRVFWTFLKLVCGEQYVYPDGHVLRIPKVAILRALSTFIIYVQLFNVLALVLITRIYLRLGYFVIAERFVLDTYADFLYFSYKFTGKKLAPCVLRILLRFLPKNMLFIYLDADYLSLRDRYKRRGTIPEPKDYVELQRIVGRMFARKFNGLMVFTPGYTIAQTHMLILRILKI
jgi:thymidylate kinase